MPVEQQVAIIFAGTRGLLKSVPVKQVKNFESEFLNHLEDNHADLLDELRKGALSDEMITKLDKIALDIAGRYH